MKFSKEGLILILKKFGVNFIYLFLNLLFKNVI